MVVCIDFKWYISIMLLLMALKSPVRDRSYLKPQVIDKLLASQERIWAIKTMYEAIRQHIKWIIIIPLPVHTFTLMDQEYFGFMLLAFKYQ